ncbi:hypothetical protein LINPERHAP1_LOCUS4636 [Linum perenne]
MIAGWIGIHESHLSPVIRLQKGLETRMMFPPPVLLWLLLSAGMFGKLETEWSFSQISSHRMTWTLQSQRTTWNGREPDPLWHLIRPGTVQLTTILTLANRQVWDGVSGTLFCSSPTVAEARTILEAIILASPLGAPTTILSDCKIIVDIVNDPSHPWPWECYALVGAILHLLQGKPWIRVCFIPRSMNKVADWVAGSARQGSLPNDWVSVLNVLHL